MAEKKSTNQSSRVAAARARAEIAKARAAEKAAIAREKKVVLTVNKQANGFLDFLRAQGVVGLAVGLAIGTVASATVKTIVTGFINPIVQLLIGTHAGLDSQVWHVVIGKRTADFQWGATLSSIITLVATAFVIYLIIHFARLDRLDKKKDA